MNVVGPSAISLNVFLTLSLDRDTVLSLAAALREVADQDEIALSVLEEVDE